MDRFAELNEDINDQYGFEKLKNISGQLEKTYYETNNIYAVKELWE